MAVTIEHSFDVGRPAEEVWRFLTDPQRVVECLPGARLLEVLDDRTFRGEVAIGFGPVQTTLRGTARFHHLDRASLAAELRARARELEGGGGAALSMSSSLQRVGASLTRIELEQAFRLSGRLALLVATGLAGDLASAVIERFASCLQEKLERAGAPASRAVGGTA